MQQNLTSGSVFQNVVRFSLPPGRYTLKVRDLAGNWAQGPLQVLG